MNLHDWVLVVYLLGVELSSSGVKADWLKSQPGISVIIRPVGSDVFIAANQIDVFHYTYGNVTWNMYVPLTKAI